MWTDQIVEEVRRSREEYAARFGHDLDAIAQDLRKQTERLEAEGWEVVSLPPRRQDPAGEVA